MLNASVTKNPQHFTPSKCFVFADLWSCEVKIKVKQKACFRRRGFQQVEAPRLGGKVCQPYAPAAFTPGGTPGTNFYYRLSRPQGHSAAGTIMSMKNSSDPIGNRTCDLPAYSAYNLSIKYEKRSKKFFLL